jgi:hypothetical protein
MLTSDRLVLVIVTLVSQVDHVKVSTIFHPNLDTLVEDGYAGMQVELSKYRLHFLASEASIKPMALRPC